MSPGWKLAGILALGTSPAAGRRRRGRRRVTVRGVVGGVAAQRLETVAAVRPEVIVEIKVRIAVLLVDAPALGHDLVDFGSAQGSGLLIRRGGRLAAAAGEVLDRRAFGQTLGKFILGEDGCCWIWSAIGLSCGAADCCLLK